MTKRSIAMLAFLALSLVTLGGWQLKNSIAVHAFESLGASTSPEQAAPPGARPVTWEYKVLAGNVYLIVDPARAKYLTYPGAHLEEDINRLAAQGYVVESIQMSAAETEPIVVLLKRIRK